MLTQQGQRVSLAHLRALTALKSLVEVHSVKDVCLSMQSLEHLYKVDSSETRERRERSVETEAGVTPWNSWKRPTYVFRRMRSVFAHWSDVLSALW